MKMPLPLGSRRARRSLLGGTCTILLAFAPLGLRAFGFAQDGDGQAGTEQGACSELREAEHKMQGLLAKIAETHRAEKLFTNKIEQSQRAWSTYRDAYLQTIFPRQDKIRYGTVLPMCQCNIKTELTEKRIADLEQWTIGIQEGDVCTGTRSTRR